MFATYLIFLLAICYAQSASVSQDVANSIPKNHTFDKFHLMMEHKSFYDALSSCESLGLKLVSIETKQDNDDITQMFVNLVDLTKQYFWTSGVRLATEDWAWLTAKTYITYTFWDQGKPDNVGGNENCLTIFSDTGTWDDKKCTLLNYYICEE